MTDEERIEAVARALFRQRHRWGVNRGDEDAVPREEHLGEVARCMDQAAGFVAMFDEAVRLNLLSLIGRFDER